MKTWTKRYAVSCLLALFVFSGIEAYRNPTDDMRVGGVILLAAVWPVTLAVLVGWTVGDFARERV
jgi:hypothetical protein